MTIEVLPQINQTPDAIFYISSEEAKIVQYVYTGMGKVAAVRVVRSFAKCDLINAVNYVNALTRTP